MKIKSNQYGVFYKDGKKWRGPIKGEIFTEEQLDQNEGSFEALEKSCGKQVKKKTRIFRQVWKSVKS